MTDKELIQALRCCVGTPDTKRCAAECAFYKGADLAECVPSMGNAVASRMEALLADNMRLTKAYDTMYRDLKRCEEAKTDLGRRLAQQMRENDGLTKQMILRNDELLKLREWNDELLRLRGWVHRWIPVTERVPALTEGEVGKIEKYGAEAAPEFIVWIKGATGSTVLKFDGEDWVDDNNVLYSVTHWMPLPERPKEAKEAKEAKEVNKDG